ncbi:MAG: DUF6293 family protein [Methanomassiliicoccaceae archaeon]|nr:DUF6293 family protein [Methanomassiliicoccaceae archaeon]
MTSGRKERVMVACVTFETVKVTDPAKYYEATRVHIVHSADERDRGSVYWEFYDRVCDVLREGRGDIEIVDHNERSVSDFSLMLRTVLGIIEGERGRDPDCDIYVNISAGSAEYSAAAAIASMMDPPTVLFSVPSAAYKVQGDRVKEYFYSEEGRPVGLTSATKEPKRLASYCIQKPDRDLVCGLRVLSARIENKRPVKGPDMIHALKENGLWYKEEDFGGADPASRRQGEAVYYYRSFVEKWLREGWVAKDESRKRYVLTPLGQNTVDTFHQPPEGSDTGRYLVLRPRDR